MISTLPLIQTYQQSFPQHDILSKTPTDMGYLSALCHGVMEQGGWLQVLLPPGPESVDNDLHQDTGCLHWWGS